MDAPTPPTGIRPAPRPADAALRAEERLILKIRRALDRGDLETAAQAIARHRRSFPAGEMADARALLHIRVLLAQGRGADARRAADAYRARAPDGLFRPAIDALVPPLDP